MRERILMRIRRALEHRPQLELPPPLNPATLGPAEARALLLRRLEENGAEAVVLEDLEAARAWLAVFTQTFDGVALGDGLPAALRPALPLRPPEEAPLGVSWALGAVAETGTVVLSSREGRRVQLLPPTHLVFVPGDRVYATLYEALSSLSHLPSVLGLHSGPSKSADIGQIMVRGVHGPGRLVVALVDQSQSDLQTPEAPQAKLKQ
ncbi:MAG: lactate utilization protein [Meiothermus sp.]|uniref:LutC/YkgG family protein n=1 Tax=Meiothermus sp. TaxID=1955249 RepID=UPI0025E77973|nr:lactate utilization protein [Meiothermus sp.]MCS7058754.1 lactate utilization protein [Meiothermus sp.]MCS7195373.1 lactate utilization protein [Meiothermus sp.]MCX7740124.1 lactate utilization protein [Meiothermus sp.]MDW8091026.1 lactate utilization protein [Meiothermus sp.]MDW8482229.1 lactate utilization protein [Meiothermus sp.]